jgi:chemotaxis protein methyltransferase CheR
VNPGVILGDSGYPALKRYIIDHTGLEYYADKDEDLATRISRRLEVGDKTNLSTYHAILRRDSAEMDCLVGELTIGETYFFRQKEHFDLLRNTIIPALIDQNGAARRIRIWSAGCATGAEPYSIAVLLGLQFEAALKDWDVTILATDINTDFLNQARAGLFGDWALRDMPPAIKASCFLAEGRRWRLLPEFRSRVSFRYHNLATAADPAPDHLPFDLILCRNVLIYFSRDIMRSVAGRLHQNLYDGGWLLVGHAEPNAETFEMFDSIAGPEGTIYRKGGSRAIAAAQSWQPAFPLTESTAGFQPLLPVDLPRGPPVTMRPAATPPASELFEVDDIRLLADSGRWDTALSAADKLVVAEPLNAAAQFTLGLILEHNGHHDRARASLRRAIYLDRAFALAHYHLGASLQATGDNVGSKKSFSNVLGLVGVIPASQPVPHGDGITAQELSDLAKMHLELIAK